MGKLSRTKGRKFEQDCAKPLRVIFGERVKRGWQTRNGSKDALDIENTPFAIECKHQERPNIFAAYEQAVEGAKHNGGIPLAIVKKNQGKALAVLSYEDFLAMVEALYDVAYFSSTQTIQGYELTASGKAMVAALEDE